MFIVASHSGNNTWTQLRSWYTDYGNNTISDANKKGGQVDGLVTVANSGKCNLCSVR